MINNLNLKRKLILALLIPVMGLVYFIFQIGLSNAKKQSELEKIEIYMDNTIYVSALVHELQKERGLSTGFIGAKGKKFKNRLLTQRKLTDKMFNQLNKNLKDLNNLAFKNFVTKALKQLDELKNTRKSIDALTISFKKTFNYFSNINSIFFKYNSALSLISHNDEISQMGISYINLLRAKEASGIERAILTNVFASEKMSSETLKEFNILTAFQKKYIKNYKELINKKQLQNFSTKMSDPSITEVAKIRELAFNKVVKDKIISDIKELAGYGGLIHNFKNYVIRGQKEDAIKFSKTYLQIQTLLKQYNNLHNSTDTEKALLNTIHKTFQKYFNALQYVVKAHEEGQTVRNLDKIVKIDDKEAIEAINILSKNIIGADASYWFEVSTKRINILKEIENEFVSDIYLKMKDIRTKLTNSIIINMFILLFIIVIILSLSLKIIYEITVSVEKFQRGLNTFFNYLTNKSDKIKLIDLKTNDEIGQMAKEVNKNIEEVQIYLEQKIEIEIEKNKEKESKIYEQSKMAALGDMIGNIAHQWRQPLSAISALASGIKLTQEIGISNKKDIVKDMTNIINKSQYLSETIDTFRDFIKEEKIYTEVVLQDRIDVSLNIIYETLANNYIEVKKNIDYNKPILIELILGELSQVIINILNNAKDILTSKKIENAWVNIMLSNDENKAMISIEDNGGGIPEDMLTKIFDPYFTTKHKSRGTGLGLHMSYKIITESLHGKIYAENTKHGAKFSIELPLDKKKNLKF